MNTQVYNKTSLFLSSFLVSPIPKLEGRLVMTTISDSSAVFNERATEVGLGDVYIQALKNQGISSYSSLAFSLGQPGETPSENDLRVLIAGGSDPAAIPIGTLSSLRKLMFEAQTLAVAHVKAMVESREDDSKKEMAPAERTDRIKRQRTRLSGLGLIGDLECGYACYDLVFKMLQTNSVTYLPPHKFVSRKAELSVEKPPKQIVLDSASHLTVKGVESEMTCETGTDLLLRDALTRRALALDMVGVASFSIVEAYNRFLMSHLRDTPPPGYNKVTIHQILKADREGWLRLAEKATDGIKKNAVGTSPLDALFPALESDPKVAFHLLPLPGGLSSSAKAASAPSQPAVNQTPKGGNQNNNPGKGKGKGKRKWKAPKNMPAELQGKQSQMKDGTPLCWNFNLKHGCKSGLGAGAKCDRGMHLCMVPGCQKSHPLHEHQQ